MTSHDVGRGRGGVDAALGRVTARSLVLGIDSDRLYTVDGQRVIAAGLGASIHGPDPIVIHSPFGHDAFLIEDELIGPPLRSLLES